MKQKLLAVVLLALIVFIAACGSDDGAANIEFYDTGDFNIELLDTEGNTVNISPDGKTIYAYFTGPN
ncbi:hypothetical protein BKP35_11640 [Anaerobacillus arseniciselenatis]|uniref:Uncharacterized protein n=1 Tax=Anaerobacillus arseniciselenatis TaxID=85682 RepID=A0A1S2LGC1_9BACI|nr:hypothetical protein [Anaerobacillus arseniciselenatis]OIJ11589.1 hypothetical protein BKP35_11640 [Anaerobacillus arseniciselenatis]